MTHVVIVDDEQGISKTLEAVLTDEGYQTSLALDGESAIELISKVKPELALIDIWLPGKDGIEVLKSVRESSPSTSVVMMSGHATIATAISATKLGAKDFIEKPLDLDRVLETISRVLKNDVSDTLPRDMANGGAADEEALSFESADIKPILPLVFEQQLCRGRRMTQKTIARGAILYGQGLHSAKKSGLILEPLPVDSGIHFVSISGGEPIPAHVNYVGDTGWATTICHGEHSVSTIEHLMSALHALGVTNLLVKCNGEIPSMDGSAREFIRAIQDAGIEEQQGGEWYAIVPPKKVRFQKAKEWIEIEPTPGEPFSIHYTLEYPAPLGKQEFYFKMSSPEDFIQEISNARTFGLIKDIGYLQRQGLALGGRFDNFVLFGDDGALNGALRFPDEPVRHKILDAIGDLYLLGRTIEGKVTAHLTGHSDNASVLAELQRAMVEWGR